jgi:hypothetical protein
MKDISELHAAVGAEALVETARSQCVPSVDEGAQRMTDLLAPRRFSAANPPPPERVIYRIGEATIATPGNLVVFYAQPKAGKTAFLGGVLAAAMAAGPVGDGGVDGDGSGAAVGADTFDVQSENPEGRPILHFDTEQSPQHHYKAIARALRRIEREAEPDWLYSYRITDIPLPDRREALRHELRTRHAQYGGVHSVFLDGVADFIADPNDPAEAFAWVDELHQLAIRYDTVIVCVLHENPGSDMGKTRGHLGSQLERKAETNLRLVKDGEGVTVVFTERSRQAHIPKENGPRFMWSEEAKRHVSCETKAKRKETARALDLRLFVDQVFTDVPDGWGLGHQDIMERIQRIDELKPSGARKRLAALVSGGFVRHSEKKYHRGNQCS